MGPVGPVGPCAPVAPGAPCGPTRQQDFGPDPVPVQQALGNMATAMAAPACCLFYVRSLFCGMAAASGSRFRFVAGALCECVRGSGAADGRGGSGGCSGAGDGDVDGATQSPWPASHRDDCGTDMGNPFLVQRRSRSQYASR